MRHILGAIKNKRGMTLTEVMVGVAIIALVSTMMASGFLAASALIRRGADVGGADSLASSYFEMTKLTNTGSAASITVDGVTIHGSYYTHESKVSDDAAAVQYSVFVPDGA